MSVQEAEPKAPAEQNHSYPSTLSVVEPAPSYRYSLSAIREPSVLSRVIEMFALRDLIPHDVTCRVEEGHEPRLLIELQVRGLEAQHAQHLAQRMRNIVPVLAVDFSIG